MPYPAVLNARKVLHCFHIFARIAQVRYVARSENMQSRDRHVRPLFQLRQNRILVRRRIPCDMQKIRLTTDLAVLYVPLLPPSGRIHGRLVPLSASGTLETHDHFSSIQGNDLDSKVQQHGRIATTDFCNLVSGPLSSPAGSLGFRGFAHGGRSSTPRPGTPLRRHICPADDPPQLAPAATSVFLRRAEDRVAVLLSPAKTSARQGAVPAPRVSSAGETARGLHGEYRYPTVWDWLENGRA